MVTTMTVAELVAGVPDGPCVPFPRAQRKAARRAIAVLESAIADAGFALSYVEFCENAATPGLLGYYLGVTNHRERTVRVARLKVAKLGIRERGVRELAAILAHELKHVLEPAWVCGNRKVI